MKTAIITLKIEEKLKKNAQKVATDLGLSLSMVIKGLLSQFVVDKKVVFGDKEEENLTPSKYLIEAMEEAKKNREEGWVSPLFDNAEDSFVWLDDPNRKYVRDLHPELYQTGKKSAKKNSRSIS